MAKTKQKSDHSRAARREGSPSLNLDSSLRNVERANDTPRHQDDILTARHGANVSKKKKQKPLSRQQRLRRDKGMARASAVVDQLETKVKSSNEKLKKIKNRSVKWEDLNADLTAVSRRSRHSVGRGIKRHLEVENGADRMEVVAGEDSDNGKAELAARSPGSIERRSSGEMDEMDGIT